MDMPQDPQDPQEAEEAEKTDGSTELCIKVAADGSLSVYMEQGDMPTGQPSPAADIADALKQIVALYRQTSTGDSQDQFNAGFGEQPAPMAGPAKRGVMA